MRLNLRRTVRIAILYSLDMLIVTGAFYIAYWIRLDIIPTRGEEWDLWNWVLLILLCVRTLCGIAVRQYHWSFRHASLPEAIGLIKGGVAGSLFFIAICRFLDLRGLGPPRSTYLMEFLLSLMGMGLIRYLPRHFFQEAARIGLYRKTLKGRMQRTLVYGAGHTGEMILRDLLRTGVSEYDIIGFVDDNPDKIGVALQGYRVLGSSDDLPYLIPRHRVEALLVAIQNIEASRLDRVMSLCAGQRVECKILPTYAELMASGDGLIARMLENTEGRIPFARVACDGTELLRVKQVLESGWLTSGRQAFEFERAFARRVGARFACAVNSCTAALHLALEALGVGPGDKVFVPTMTFTATAEVIRYLGADPVFLDVEYGSFLLTPEIVRRAIERHGAVKALVVVHYGGQAAEMLDTDRGPGILGLCRARGIRVVEDAAHAFPARAGGRMVGSLGDVTCFSFYANKTITTGEGGMLTTDDEAVARRVKVMRLHGIDRDSWNRFGTETPSWEYDVVAPGFKYNLPDLCAAIGLAQLERADPLRRERERCARHYLAELASLDGLDLPRLHVTLEDHAWHLFPIVLKESARLSRNRLIELLAEEGIGVSVHYKPLHRMKYYEERYALRAADFPNAERLWRGCLSLPIYPSLTTQELKTITGALRDLLK
ncbi:MAG: aminotransferase class I/II-fold pyridoxal phosphate-dependent enzyme [Planctomycetota bacterium]